MTWDGIERRRAPPIAFEANKKSDEKSFPSFAKPISFAINFHFHSISLAAAKMFEKGTSSL